MDPGNKCRDDIKAWHGAKTRKAPANAVAGAFFFVAGKDATCEAVLGGALHRRRAQRFRDHLDGAAPILRAPIVGAQPEGEQRVGRQPAVTEEARARGAGDAHRLMPLQRIDVVETHSTPPRCAPLWMPRRGSFYWLASTQSAVAPLRETRSRGASWRPASPTLHMLAISSEGPSSPLPKRLRGALTLSTPTLWGCPSMATGCR